MFNAAWILRQARPMPDAARLRRPVLVARRSFGQRIEPDWPFPEGTPPAAMLYPARAAGLNGAADQNEIPPEVGRPGEDRWAQVLATIDKPVVAIPLVGEAGAVAVRL